MRAYRCNLCQQFKNGFAAFNFYGHTRDAYQVTDEPKNAVSVDATWENVDLCDLCFEAFDKWFKETRDMVVSEDVQKVIDEVREERMESGKCKAG
jgi:hypothetical protein